MSKPLSMSTKRISKELVDIHKEVLDGITVEPKSSQNMYEWVAKMNGPADSCYSGGVFVLDVKLPHDYPFKAPMVKFRTPIYHPNINRDGAICLDILKNQWSPALTVLKVLLSISSLLCDPNPDDPLVAEIARQYKNDRQAYDSAARLYTKRYAMREPQVNSLSSKPKSSTTTSTSTSTTSSPTPTTATNTSNKRQKTSTSTTSTPTNNNTSTTATTATRTNSGEFINLVDDDD